MENCRHCAYFRTDSENKYYCWCAKDGEDRHQRDNRQVDPYGSACIHNSDNTAIEVANRMRAEWDSFVKEHGHEPKFAHTVTKYGDEEPAMDVIKVSGFDKEDTENDPDDNYVMFYADGINELCQINTDGIADFIITDFHGFSDDI